MRVERGKAGTRAGAAQADSTLRRFSSALADSVQGCAAGSRQQHRQGAYLYLTSIQTSARASSANTTEKPKTVAQPADWSRQHRSAWQPDKHACKLCGNDMNADLGQQERLAVTEEGCLSGILQAGQGQYLWHARTHARTHACTNSLTNSLTLCADSQLK